MQQKETGRGDPSEPFEVLRKLVPFEPHASSLRRGWVGLEAFRYRETPDFEFCPPALNHHRLVLYIRPPEGFDLVYDGVKRHTPPPVGSVSVVLAGRPARVRWSGAKHELHIFLEPELVARVAAEAFDLDPARVAIPAIDGLDLPPLRAAMEAVGAELTAGTASGGPLAAESLANVLAVHLIRHVVAPGRAARGRDGVLPRWRLRAVLEYIEEHLDAAPTLAEIAAVAGLNPYHFARQFKTATGLPPHQYVITRRVERAKLLLRAGTGLSLAEVAALAGFYDQSQFAHHFKRLVGVTPSQFRTPSRIA
ncbi:MAG: AraC family transcriptional regulator [Anaerolinea sp.]|nr:AraC family transcriptional regulator [Anaerolinea sp.]